MDTDRDRTNATSERAGLHALFAYAASVLLVILVGARWQHGHLNSGLILTELCLIALPAAVLLFLRRDTQDWRQFSLPTFRQGGVAVLIGGCAALIATAKGIAIRQALLGIKPSAGEAIPGVSLLALVLLAPLCEEFLFRAAIQNGLERIWRSRTVVLVTALLFGLFHLSILRLGETAVVGLYAGIVFLKTRRFWCAVLVHAMCNALGLVLWQHAAPLGPLLHPVASVAIGCVSVALCYRIGERFPAECRGIRQRLLWALFGTREENRAASPASRRPVVYLTAIVLALAVLIGYGTVALLKVHHNHLEPDVVVQQEDVWRIASPESVHATSSLALQVMPKASKDLELHLPLAEAVLDAVTCEQQELCLVTVGQGVYRVDLAGCWDNLPRETITVIWHFPITALAEGHPGYRVPLASLVPSTSFSVKVEIEPGSGFRFIGQPEQQECSLFRMGQDHAKLVYGTCGMMVEKADD